MLLLWLFLWMLVMLLLLILLLPSLVWCQYTFSSFCHVYLSCIIFNLAPNYNLLILFYCAIYFLTLSIFILSHLPIISSIHFFALPFFQNKTWQFQSVAFSKFNSSQMLEFDDSLLVYSSCLIFLF